MSAKCHAHEQRTKGAHEPRFPTSSLRAQTPRTNPPWRRAALFAGAALSPLCALRHSKMVNPHSMAIGDKAT
jgi:hypothetical protein